MVRGIFLVCGIVLAAVFSSFEGFGSSDSSLRSLANARARVVWVEDQGPGSADVFARGRMLRLMGYDSDDRKGPRPIVDSIGSIAKPMVVPGGDRVVFSDRRARRAYVVDWDGSNLRKIVDGFVLEAWRDPADGRSWIYYQVEGDGDHGSQRQPIHRTLLDDPTVDELVWNQSPVSVDNFQISGDGRTASILTPWPRGGVVDLEEPALTGIAKGCWVSVSPDDRRLFWIFDFDHRNLAIHPLDGGEPWAVRIDGGEGIEGFEVYHPRWSNHPDLFVVTGPYRVGEGPNRIRAGGPAVEIHVGRFSKDLRKVEGWVRVTENGRGDYFPDLWVEPS